MPRAGHLDRTTWHARAESHRARVEPWIAPRLERRRRGERHPVDDFLFDYYSFRPGQLARWHPGAGTTLEAPAESVVAVRGYVGAGGRVGLDPAAVARQASLLPGIDRLLAATQQRTPRLSCWGLHEWAMVYRAEPGQIRHSDWPLRLPGAEIADVVEDLGLRCTHFDAYRFFTAEAVPRNAAQLSRQAQVDHEQPGCLHATMDLYKWAFRLSPLIGADLIADAFALARDARDLDMRGAPYDLGPLGVQPIPIETRAGRARFVELQRDLAARGDVLRQRLRDSIAVAQSWLSGTPAGYRSS